MFINLIALLILSLSLLLLSFVLQWHWLHRWYEHSEKSGSALLREPDKPREATSRG
jgi:hypothetical protein